MFDIEGPLPGAQFVGFILGARPIEPTDFDLSFAGSISSAIFSPSRAPSMFSTCVLACLESFSFNPPLSGSVDSLPFDVTARQLVLLGPAAPQEITDALRSIVYLNRSPALNVVRFQLEVFDGIATATDSVYVEQQLQGRRRRSVAKATRSVPSRTRHLLSFHEVDGIRADDDLELVESEHEIQKKSFNSIPSEWVAPIWPTVVGVVSIAVVAIAILLVAGWAIKRKRNRGNMA